MKLKKTNLFIIILIFIISIFCLSCSNEHTHTYGEWNIVQKATCEISGIKEKSCSCGDKISDKIPALGHNYLNGQCTDCGKIE